MKLVIATLVFLTVTQTTFASFPTDCNRRLTGLLGYFSVLKQTVYTTKDGKQQLALNIRKTGVGYSVAKDTCIIVSPTCDSVNSYLMNEGLNKCLYIHQYGQEPK